MTSDGPSEDEQPILLSQEIMKGTEHQLHSTSLDDDSVSRIIRASQPSISEDESEDRIKSKMEIEADDIDMNGENEEKASNLSQEENSSEQSYKSLHLMSKSEKKKHMIQFLLSQSDIFKKFLTPVEEKKPSKTRSKSMKKTRRNSIEEKEDDLEMLKEQMQPVNNIYIHIQPSCIKGTMRSYQIEALNWLVNQFLNGLNCILADEMGLGKTLEAISLLGFLKQYYNYSGPHLILVPKSTLGNWMNEIRTWCPSLRPIKLHGDKEERQAFIKDNINHYHGQWDVLVTTYEMFIIEKHALSKLEYKYIIIDEAHRIKNENSKLSMMLREVQSNNRLLLTGTPLQKNLHELWSLLNYLMPEVFDNSDLFNSVFNIEESEKLEETESIINQLHRILRPFMLRRLKVDVENKLPPKHETILYIGMSKLQKELYKSIYLKDFSQLQKDGKEPVHLLNIMMQLRKMADHPYLFEGVEDRSLDPNGDHLITNCGKMVLLDKLLKRLKERGSRVLLFSQMARMLDILEVYRKEEGRSLLGLL